jgi:hypothetical protein
MPDEQLDRTTFRRPLMDTDSWLVTRQPGVDLLPLMRLSPSQEARLMALDYPVDFATAARAFESVGVDMDVLTDRMGGSP